MPGIAPRSVVAESARTPLKKPRSAFLVARTDAREGQNGADAAVCCDALTAVGTNLAGTDRSTIAAAHPVDLSTVSFRRAPGTAVTHGERELERVVAFRWGRAPIVEALGGERGINSLGDEFGHVDDPLALVDTCFHVITHSHW